MRAITATVGPLAAASANNIALSQTPAAAFTLNGSTVTSGVATLDAPRRVLFTQVGSETGKTYTIVGTTYGGTPQTEILAAATGAGTVNSNLDFLTVTSIRISSAAGAAITVGTNGIASSRWVRLDEWGNPNATMQATVTGTVNYTVQETMQSPDDPTNPVPAYLVTWTDNIDPNLNGQTATWASYYYHVPIFTRVLLNSGTGSVSLVVAQSNVVNR